MVETENWDALQWTAVRRGVERKVILTTATTLQLVRFHPGHDINPHAHDFEQVAYILSAPSITLLPTKRATWLHTAWWLVRHLRSRPVLVITVKT